MSELLRDRRATFLLIGAFVLSAAIKLVNLHSGGPQIEIDDYTLYNGAFSVWFGNAPPQHMYVESWLCGIVCLLTYVFKTAMHSGVSGLVSINLAADAYRDYTQSPDAYYATYRAFVLAVDLATAFLVYKAARIVLAGACLPYAAVLVATLYLFSYNTVWTGLVGRPDIFVSFFGALGFLLYLKSGYQFKSPYFWCAAAAFGVAAGFKLHGAFFAIFISLDLLRVWGLRRAVAPIVGLGVVSLIFFSVAAGTLLFDPLLYVKLRLLNYSDDISTHLTWGTQLIAILKGTGWVLLPVVLVSALVLRRGSLRQADNSVKSVLLLSICWLLLFASIRQLRAYWMLPALPLAYLSAVYLISRLPISVWRKVAVGTLLVAFVGQSIYEADQLRSGGHDELRNYVTRNIRSDETFFVLGFSILVLPRNTDNMRVAGEEIAGRIKRKPNDSETFAYRHVKNWEESSQLMLFDMLNYRSEQGYDYYNFYDHDESFFVELAGSKQPRFVILADGFPLKVYPGIERILNDDYVLDDERRGPGGGGLGMRYRIYKKS